MGELKVHRFLGSDEVRPTTTIGNDFYLKSEVDKVLAEKDTEIAKLKVHGFVGADEIRPAATIGNDLESNQPPKPVAFFDHRNEPDCTMEYQVYDKQEADAYIHWLERKAGVL